MLEADGSLTVKWSDIQLWQKRLLVIPNRFVTPGGNPSHARAAVDRQMAHQFWTLQQVSLRAERAICCKQLAHSPSLCVMLVLASSNAPALECTAAQPS